MATGYVSSGDVLEYLNSGSAIASGEIVNVGGVVGIALGDIASGAYGALQTCGVWNLPKITGSIAVGATIDYDVSAGAFGSGITAATGDVENCGVCVEAAASGDATVKVMLLPGKGVTA